MYCYFKLLLLLLLLLSCLSVLFYCSANILLDKHFVPKLSDFGLARELSNQSSRSSTTFSSRSAVVRGTMAYMAPEFVRNRKLTTRTDVYAYGVVLLELHTGLPALSENHTQEEEPVLVLMYNRTEQGWVVGMETC